LFAVKARDDPLVAAETTDPVMLIGDPEMSTGALHLSIEVLKHNRVDPCI
jgi:hypothetical protein